MGLTLSHYLPLFQQENITLKDLMRGYTEEELQQIGIDKKGDRKRILDEAVKLVTAKWHPQSLPPLRTKSDLR